jgi:cysteine-rich repeat protein
LKDKTSIVSGEIVTFTVTARNDSATACDVTGTTITFHCPAADGTPTGAATVCASNADFLVPFAPTTLCVVPCTVTVNPGVTSAQALVDGAGTLHDNPDNDFDSADIHRTLSVIIRTCGDGTINDSGCGETCDTNAFPAGAPSSHGSCRLGPCGNPGACTFCGDGIVNGEEQCDDGNGIDTDGCRNNCLLPVCGDSIVGNTPGETCDPPGSTPPTPPGNTNLCRPLGPDQCTYCGDGIVNDGETCDDGNHTNGDGCENDCTLSPICGDGIVGNTPGETCDPPGSTPPTPPGNTNLCRPLGPDQCTYCGDGIVNDGETCDDGNHTNGDGCENDCTPSPICGDGIINQSGCGETCDTNAFPAGAPSSHGSCRPGPCGNPAACTFCGDSIVNGGEECDDGNAVDTDACSNSCQLPQGCSVVIAKTVAPDDGSGGGTACDGVADGPFVESVTVDQTTCVVYQICVTNTGLQVLNSNGVKVGDPVLGTVNLDFGTIAPGATVCKQAPGVFTAPTCTGGNPAGTSCLCSEVAGVNTATITSAICQNTNQDACAQQGSDCSDTANVACLGPGSCRMTGGHNFDVVDAEFDENGKVYTTGGQIGAPNETGCCDLPPKGKCVSGLCTGGLNGGKTCATNDDCPNDPGRNSHCPWGDWEHNHHSGPDDSGSVKGGSFAFHSGTAAAPNEAFIKSVLCADPGWCVQARPAPFKQIFWEGTGVFHNNKSAKNQDIPLPIFGACGANQPKPYSSKLGGTLHYYKAHVSDFGEPAGIFQKPVGACKMDESCTNPEPNGSVEISNCALGNVCLVDSVADPVKTALHPLCLAQTCSECPDAYEIEIHCTADPASPVAYRVSHFIREGNFQLHPPVGDSCNPSCGDGVCDPGATGTAETCQSCPSDCCP